MSEYTRLCQEISSNSNVIASVFTLSVTATAVFLGIGFKSKNKSWALFLIPLLILIPSLWFITSQLESTVRIASYISACIENVNDNMNWESHLMDIRKSGMRQRIWDYTSPDTFYTRSISSIYLVLALSCFIPAYYYLKKKGNKTQYGVFCILSAFLFIGLLLVMNKTRNVMRPIMFEKYIDEHCRVNYRNRLKPGSNIHIEVSATRTINKLISEEDTDGDNNITIKDIKLRSGIRGDSLFKFIDCDGKEYSLSGTYHLSNLLQELAWSVEQGCSTTTLHSKYIFENPVKRISRLIRERYWPNLIRRVDVNNFTNILPDSKMPESSELYLYYPESDSNAVKHFGADTFFIDGDKVPADSFYIEGKKVNIAKLRSKDQIKLYYIDTLANKHGLLSLKLRLRSDGDGVEGVPYVVPGGRFNEMYGWDSYFEALGLIQDGRCDLARDMVENFLYEIEHYGKILNGNRTYYLTRSQPPFLTSMALAVYNSCDVDTTWLKSAIRAAIIEYKTVWRGEDRNIEHLGLSQYYGEGFGVPPEVEISHFNKVYKEFVKKYKMKEKDTNKYMKDYKGEYEKELKRFASEYATGVIKVPALDTFHKHDRAMRESGHDRSYRWLINKKMKKTTAERDRCSNFVTVDLNCLLYKYEIDIARTIEKVFGGRLEVNGYEEKTNEDWIELANKRRSKILDKLWDNKKGLFFDYNHVDSTLNDYLTATVFYALWACHPDNPSTFILSEELADKMVAAVLTPDMLEQAGGLSASSKKSRDLIKHRIKDDDRQWDYPFGWAPHQMIAWQGLKNYGNKFEEDINRLIYKWLYMITINAKDHNGTIPEKFDVVKKSHDVFVEYGNVGIKFDYITKEGFGWMNASYQVGLSLLSPVYVKELENLTPPEKLFVQ